MIELREYIFLLLIIAGISMSFIIRVIRQQLKLLKLPVGDEEIAHFRKILFYISIVIVVMGLIPVTINLITLFFDVNRPKRISGISLAYSLSVHIQSLLLSYLLWRMYRLAGMDRHKK